MELRTKIILNILCILMTFSHDGRADGFSSSCDRVSEQLVRLFPSSADRDELEIVYKHARATAEERGYRLGYCAALLQNLTRKARSMQEGVRFTPKQIEATTILFEIFRVDTYLSAGVAPKVYFGLLDGKGATARYENRIREVLNAAIPEINLYAASHGMRSRVTAQEVAVTFLAEGGALLLTDERESIDRLHPVRHVGLDDFRTGFAAHEELVGRLDTLLRTRMGALTIPWIGKSILVRPMTFTEGILGTAVMYLYEKEIVATRRDEAYLVPLMSLSLREQFVHTSLVYNSGISFSDERVRQILEFDTAQYLVDLSAKNEGFKAPLPVLRPERALEQLSQGDLPLRQLTTWSAVYHILQRYGAWVALERFAEIFDDQGAFIPLS